MKGVPDNIKDKLPKDFEDNWEVVSIGDIKLNDYISYIPKPRKYKSRDSETKQEMIKGGYVTYLPDDDQKEIKGVKENVIGLRNYRSKWSISEDNVYFFCRSKKDSKEILAKGTAKALKTKDATRKRAAELLQEDIKEAKELSKSDKIKQAFVDADAADEPEKSEDKPEEPAPKRKRGRPKKESKE
jgi:hypothetical protein